MSVTVLGIRHHGPGSARSVVEELRALRPDCLLIEGPPDADALIPLVTHEQMRPPVALLLYDPDAPEDAGFYPFAMFSPEWQAMRHALEAGVPVRFMDLPFGRTLAIRRQRRVRLEAERAADADTTDATDADATDADAGDADATDADAGDTDDAGSHLRSDPIGELARAAGEADGERWWDRLVESRRTAGDVFAAIAEAMGAVRSAIPDEDPETQLREAAMRRELRVAEHAGYARIAVVCGAYHVPALVDRPPVARDDALFREVPRAVKVAVAWVPWTYGRLSAASGYGAGITSPGWYEHLWKGREPLAVTWMTRVARTFRQADLDVSPAHLIEATRLAETLAALRGRAIPSLEELNDAIRSTMTSGSDVELGIVRDQLIVGTAMGRIPDDAPIAPLAADLAREQKRLRLRPEEAEKTLDLDLRGAIDLGRSQLLHRLRLLDVPWGTAERIRGKAGTFHEIWRLAWRPEYVVGLIAGSRYGATIEGAASARSIERASASDRLAELTTLVEDGLLADLPTAVEAIVKRIGAVAAIRADVPALMAALPPLARVLRYGNVRGTDAESVAGVVDGFVERIAIGLAGACSSLDDDAAREMTPLVEATSGAVALLDDPAHRATWRGALLGLVEQHGLHGLLSGRVTRLLLDDRALEPYEVARRMRLALSRGVAPAEAGAWVEGFLGASGTILLHDEALFGVLDGWLTDLSREAFEPILPLLRRTVSTFPSGERRALGDHVRRRRVDLAPTHDATLDEARADAVLPILGRLLGLDLTPDE